MSKPIAVFPRGGGSEVRVTVNEFKGVTRADLRVYYQKADGTLSPTQKGVGFALDELPDLIAALSSIEVQP